MTIAQDRYFDVIDNPDGSKTLVGIVEFEAEDINRICLFRFHGSTVLLSSLYGSRTFKSHPEMAINIIWKKYIESTGTNPYKINWIRHDGVFSGGRGKADIRNPYSSYSPEHGKIVSYYAPIFVKWNGDRFITDDSEKYLFGNNFSEQESERLTRCNFSTVEAITKHFKWARGINRMDIEYLKEHTNSDGSTTIKTIFFWEHPLHPSHCLVRIWLRESETVIIISELSSNIPPFLDDLYHADKITNRASKCLPQIINGVFTKIRAWHSPYRIDNINWIYEWGDFSTYDDRISWGVYNSSFEKINVSYDVENTLTVRPEEISNSEQDLQSVLRSDFFGDVVESCQELGWNCR
jgi:hypothetical protein